MKVLVIEDDARTASFIRQGLAEAGHTVEMAADGEEGLFLALNASPDVLVVDRMLPGRDGLSVVRSLRSEGLRAPVLFLTAMGGVEDRVEGLEAGGDDYLVKPFAFSELLARVNALARRPPLSDAPKQVTIGDLEVDLQKRRVSRAGQRIELTSQEFRLLEFLVSRQGQVVTRSMLLESLWGFHFDPRTNIVDAHVSRLRAKLNRHGDTDLIRTIRGAGYVIDEPG